MLTAAIVVAFSVSGVWWIVATWTRLRALPREAAGCDITVHQPSIAVDSRNDRSDARVAR